MQVQERGDRERVVQAADDGVGVIRAGRDVQVRGPDAGQGAITTPARVARRVNAQLARVEQIKKWHVLERDFLQDEGEVTPTLKVRRKAIIEKYGDVIESMY